MTIAWLGANFHTLLQPAPPAEPQVAAAMEEQLDLSVWDPMGEADRDRIRAFYEDRVSTARFYQAIQAHSSAFVYHRPWSSSPSFRFVPGISFLLALLNRRRLVSQNVETSNAAILRWG